LLDCRRAVAIQQIEKLVGYRMVRLGSKKHTARKKQCMCWMVIILCQWDFCEQIEKLVGYRMVQLGSKMVIMLCQWGFCEQIEKLVRLFLCTSENCSRKFQDWVHFVPSANGGLMHEDPSVQWRYAVSTKKCLKTFRRSVMPIFFQSTVLQEDYYALHFVKCYQDSEVQSN
jgi:hypothetical protein